MCWVLLISVDSCMLSVMFCVLDSCVMCCSWCVLVVLNLVLYSLLIMLDVVLILMSFIFFGVWNLKFLLVCSVSSV